MRKFLIIIILFLLCSCSKNNLKTTACTLNYEDESYTQYLIDYEDNDVFKIVEIDYARAQSTENADEIAELYENIQITLEDVEGYDIEVERIDDTCLKITITIDYTKIPTDYLISLFGFTEEEAMAKKANYTYEELINDFKTNEYVCE